MLGFDPLTTGVGLTQTVEHPVAGGDNERKLGDAFDYALEDEMIREVTASSARLAKLAGSMKYEHNYDHPERTSRTPQT